MRYQNWKWVPSSVARADHRIARGESRRPDPKTPSVASRIWAGTWKVATRQKPPSRKAVKSRLGARRTRLPLVGSDTSNHPSTVCWEGAPWRASQDATSHWERPPSEWGPSHRSRAHRLRWRHRRGEVGTGGTGHSREFRMVVQNLTALGFLASGLIS